MDVNPLNPFVHGFFSAFKIPTRLTVTEWADEFRILPSKGSASPGKYRSSRTPYMREPMDCLSTSSPVQEVALMAAAQTGKSESGNNWVGYVIDNAPAPMLLVQPTVDNAQKYSKQRITPMIQESPTLAAKVMENKSRDSGNTILVKEFPGGMLMMGGANSASGLRSMPIRYLFCDEISNWPADVDGEGSPLELAQERTNTFGRKRKIFKCSTPATKGTCAIEGEYLKTDQRKYHVPCPHCGHKHELVWENFIIPKNDNGRMMHTKAHMACPSCGGVIQEHHKTDLLNGGEWVVTCPDNIDPTRRGYHISALYSPIGWKSWAQIARQWIEAQGSPSKLKAFFNNVLALTWSDAGEAVNSHDLQERAEAYDLSMLPDGVLLLTAGVDVQPDRLEVELVGWGVGEESWSIDYQIIRGDPEGALVWQQLDLYLTKKHAHPVGVELSPAMTFIDSGGHNTVAVYNYVRDRAAMGVYAIKGVGGEGKAAVGNPTKNNIGKIPLVPLGVNSLKETVYGRLRITEQGRGYCHFPARYGKDYFEQLTAEEVRVRYDKKGFPVREWFKKNDSARNEALDCRVYATAAMLQGNFDFDQIAEWYAGKADQQPAERRVRGSYGE